MTKFEIVQEIVTVASILTKFNAEHIMEKRDEFIAFLNEIGIKNEQGRQLNQSNFRKMVSELTDEEKRILVEEYNEGFESIYRAMTMHSNK